MVWKPPSDEQNPAIQLLEKAKSEAQKTGKVSRWTQLQMKGLGMQLPSGKQLQENASAIQQGRTPQNVNSPTGQWTGTPPTGIGSGPRMSAPANASMHAASTSVPNTQPTSGRSTMGDPTQRALATVQGARPRTLQTFNPRFRPGETIDLSRLYNAIGDRPEQEFGMDELRTLLEAQRTAGNLPQDRTFTLDMLLQAIQGANQAAQPVDVPGQRFGNPDQMAQLIQQMTGVLQPLTDARMQSAEAGFNQSLRRLQDQWAARGMLGSSALSAQEQRGAQEFGMELDRIAAEQQAQAIPLALQFGQMGLAEDAQRFDQQMANQQLMANLAQNYVQNLAAGMSQEEAMRQFQAQFEQARAQNAVGNMMGALGLQEEQLQNYLQNLTNATGMDMQQNQWSQEFGLERQAADFNRWLQTQGLNQQAQSDWMRNLLTASGQAADYSLSNRQLEETMRQFNEQMSEGRRQFDSTFGEEQLMNRLSSLLSLADRTGNMPQFNGDLLSTLIGMSGQQTLGGRAQDMAEMESQFGMTMGLSNLLGSLTPFGSQMGSLQDMAGTPTMPYLQWQADMSGINPLTGQPTFAAQGTQMEALMNLLGMFPNVQSGLGNPLQGGLYSGLGEVLNGLAGQQTLPAWQTQQNNSARLAEIQAQREARLAEIRAQIESQEGFSDEERQAMDQALREAERFYKAGDMQGVIRALTTAGIDPNAWFAAVETGSGHSQALPPSQEIYEFANRYGMDTSTAGIAQQLMHLQGDALLAEIRRLEDSMGPTHKSGIDWGRLRRWARERGTPQAQTQTQQRSVSVGPGANTGYTNPDWNWFETYIMSGLPGTSQWRERVTNELGIEPSTRQPRPMRWPWQQ